MKVRRDQCTRCLKHYDDCACDDEFIEEPTPTMHDDMTRLRTDVRADPDRFLSMPMVGWRAAYPRIPLSLMRSMFEHFNRDPDSFIAVPRVFDPSVWFQVSRSHRSLARLPDGMTGIEALESISKDRPGWAAGMGEGNAGEHFMRVYGRDPELRAELTPEEFELFRKAGGKSYGGWYFDTQRKLAEEEISRATTCTYHEAMRGLLSWSDRLTYTTNRDDTHLISSVLGAYAKRRKQLVLEVLARRGGGE